MKYDDIVIESLVQFLDWVMKNGRIKTYYRGQSSREWNLTPSVFRRNYSEHNILNRAEILLWKELSIYTKYLDKLIFLQHYGLPTRLLDVTFNPLVAIYMACEYSKEEYTDDGAIYWGVKCSDQTPLAAELIAKYIFTEQYVMSSDDIDSFAKRNHIPTKDLCSACFIIPPIANPRLEQQLGAFVMAPYSKKDYSPFHANCSLDSYNLFDKNRLIIPKEKKKQILKELATIGINRASLFVDITSKLFSIKREEEWRIDDIEKIQLS